MRNYWKKSTKKKMSDNLIQQFEQIDALLKNARKVLVASHQHPDPDAVASVLTCHYVFKKQNLESLPYLPDLPPKNLSFLPIFLRLEMK